MLRRVSRLVVAAALCTTLVGCTSATPTGPGSARQQPETSAPAVQAMEPGQMRAAIDTSFPIEVPVAAGEVVRGEAQGTDAWDYEVIVATTPAVLADWYAQSYVARSWVMTNQRVLEGGGFEQTFTKGGAQSRVTITPQGTGAKAAVILGVGAPVLETQ